MSQHAPVGLLPLFGQTAEPPRPSEAEKGRRAVEAAGLNRRDYIDRIRARMRELYRDRAVIVGMEHARVTPDDARQAFEEMDPPAGISRNFLAFVFRSPEWEVVGQHVSTTGGSHGNKLNAYAWRGARR